MKPSGLNGVLIMQSKTSFFINPSLAQADYLPDTAYLRPKICAQLMGVSIATFWRLVSSGKLKTHKLTERTTTVKVGDLRAFLAEKAGV
jgi:predicted DNA-binding protein (UPF0251 family)